MIVSKRVDWILANSYVKKNLCALGRKTNYLYSLLIFAYGVARICHLYLLQIKHKHRSYVTEDHLVVESAAPHMHLNYFRNFNKEEDSSNYILIKCFDKFQYTSILKVPLLSILREFYITFKEIYPIIEDLKLILNRNNVIKEVMISLPVFSYFVSLFIALKKNNPNLKLFSGGAPLISSAAILVGIETYYLSHGLINKPIQRENISLNPQDYFLVYPQYDHIFTYSKEEKEYLKSFGNNSSFYQYPYKRLVDLKKKIVIFFHAVDAMMSKRKLENIISLFNANNYEVIIKIHPSNIGSLYKQISDTHKIRVENKKELSASEFLKIEKPEFACGWLSATICEALYLGIVPICLNDEDESFFDELVYPLKRKSFLWDSEQQFISSNIREKDFDSTQLINLLNDR
jgi:hypothetical protein